MQSATSAYSAPVLRDQGPDRPAGHGKADHHGGDLILIRVLHRGLFPEDRTCHLHERCTAGDRYEALDSDGLWTKSGPGYIALRSASTSSRIAICEAFWTQKKCKNRWHLPARLGRYGRRLAYRTAG